MCNCLHPGKCNHCLKFIINGHNRICLIPFALWLITLLSSYKRIRLCKRNDICRWYDCCLETLKPYSFCHGISVELFVVLPTDVIVAHNQLGATVSMLCQLLFYPLCLNTHLSIHPWTSGLCLVVFTHIRIHCNSYAKKENAVMSAYRKPFLLLDGIQLN